MDGHLLSMRAFALPCKTALISCTEVTIPRPVLFYSLHRYNTFHGQSPLLIKSLKTPLG